MKTFYLLKVKNNKNGRENYLLFSSRLNQNKQNFTF
jgi:hypothetical protein